MSDLEMAVARDARAMAKALREGGPGGHAGLEVEVARLLDLLANLAVSVGANSDVLEEVVQDVNRMHEREAHLSQRIAAVSTRSMRDAHALSDQIEKLGVPRAVIKATAIGGTEGTLRTTLVRVGALLQRIKRHVECPRHAWDWSAEVQAALEDIDSALK